MSIRARAIVRAIAILLLLSLPVVAACGSGNGSAVPTGAVAGASGMPGVSAGEASGIGGSGAPGGGGTPGGSGAPGEQPAATGGDGHADTFDEIPALVHEVEPSVVTVIRDGGLGSGVVWSQDTIVTNNHVVEGVTDVVVALADGTRTDGRVLATDPLSDLAIVRTERADLPAATFAAALPEVGSLAVAIGSPLGVENTATAGIVSGLGRSIPGAAQSAPALVDLIQTDAPISPGNSGGALVGPDGSIIGINVAYIPPEAKAVSIGFAIPAPTVTDVVGQLLEDGTVDHAFLGIQQAPITPQIASRFGLEGVTGVLIVDVVSGGPADKAGIRPGDVLQGIGDDRIEASEDVLTALRHHRPGETVAVRLLRDGKETTVQATLANLPG
ncbi:MAG TPA: trypsin-like peptidase domain-containing protein [Candidatus Limnocylindrales bacterium]|jgi:S1-C subfamily serine protease